jgi:putative FmdB family regulatory protein
MPIYEYLCESCGKRFEATRSIKESSTMIGCPSCDGIGKKIPSLSTFHLKGGGWYKDSYSGKSCSLDKKKG